MAKISPSQQKMKIAKKFANELHRRTGANLMAVFAVGSAAAGIAVPNSDIDMIVVCDEIASASRYGDFLSHEFYNIIGKREKAHIDFISTADFESRGKNEPKAFLVISRLSDGAIPIFGREYADKHKECWRYPSLKTIRERYIPPVKRIPGLIHESRLEFKRNKGRFLRA